MIDSRTAGRALIAGHVALALLLGGWAALSVRELRRALRAQDEVVETRARALVGVERLRGDIQREESRARSFLLTGYEPFLVERGQAQHGVSRTLGELRESLNDPREQEELTLIAALDEEIEQVVARAVELRLRKGPDAAQVGPLAEAELQGRRERLEAALSALALRERRMLLDAQEGARALASRSMRALLAVDGGALLLALVLAALLARAFQTVRKSQAELERRNRDLDAFAGRVAHDLRSILCALPLTAALARAQGAADSVSGRIERVARRAGGLIDGLLAFARAGKPAEGPASASVREAAIEVLDDLAPLVREVDAAVELDVPELFVGCAPVLLQVVLTNLASNALKFLAGRQARRVRIAAASVAGSCELRVEDTGPGIEPEFVRRIFEPFYRAPGVAAEGSGLGLATVQRIVSAYGGTVEVLSTPGQGTSMRVMLPIAEAPPSEPRAPRSVAPLARAEPATLVPRVTPDTAAVLRKR